MNEFFNPNMQENDQPEAGGVVYDEPAPEINIVVDDGGYCRKCGNRIEPTDAFCSKCGMPTYGSAQPQQTQQYGQTRQPGQFAESLRKAIAAELPPDKYEQLQQHMQQQQQRNQQHMQQTQGTQVINNYYYNSNNTVNSNNNVNSGNAVNTRVSVNGKKMKDKYVALLLCIFFGWAGVHRFYEGKIISGIVWACSGGLSGVGWLIDFLILLFKPRYYEP